LRKKLNPAAIIGIVIVALIGIGLLGWQLTSSASSEKQITVKADNPNDPKFRPDPKLNVAGGGGAQAPQSNSND
jgi:hypothetical protein